MPENTSCKAGVFVFVVVVLRLFIYLREKAEQARENMSWGKGQREWEKQTP